MIGFVEENLRMFKNAKSMQTGKSKKIQKPIDDINSSVSIGIGRNIVKRILHTYVLPELCNQEF